MCYKGKLPFLAPGEPPQQLISNNELEEGPIPHMAHGGPLWFVALGTDFFSSMQIGTRRTHISPFSFPFPIKNKDSLRFCVGRYAKDCVSYSLLFA